jgi:hypothetical protein
MSTREIAKVAGVSKSTVANERGVQKWTPDAEPARVIGADGKSYPGRVIREGLGASPLGYSPQVAIRKRLECRRVQVDALE